MVLVLAISVLPANSASMKERLGSGEFGTRINLFAGDTSFTSDTSTYLWHGYGGGTSEDVKALEPLTFHLYIDGQNVVLRSFTYTFKDCNVAPTKNCVVFGTIWYAIFDAGYFTPGQYEFHGIWGSRIGTLLELTITVTVT